MDQLPIVEKEDPFADLFENSLSVAFRNSSLSFQVLFQVSSFETLHYDGDRLVRDEGKRVVVLYDLVWLKVGQRIYFFPKTDDLNRSPVILQEFYGELLPRLAIDCPKNLAKAASP